MVSSQKKKEEAMRVGVPRVRSPLSRWWVKSARAKHPFLVGFFWLDLPVGGS